MMPEDSPTKLYANTNNAEGILKNGFNGTQHGKYSNYNWFSTTADAGGTGRVGQGTTLGIEGVNVSNAHTITKAQTTAWRLDAMGELGYTKEGLSSLQKSNSKAYGEAMSKINGSMYSKVGSYMDKMGSNAYYLAKDGTYAVSDAVANKGTISSLNGSASTIKVLNGLKIGGRALVFVAAGLDAYEIHSSGYEARTIAGVAGGWAGAVMGSKLGASAGAAIGAPAAGIGGYFSGKAAATTTYDYITRPGIRPGRR